MSLRINQVPIDDTFAEGFGVRATRIDVTAIDDRWLQAASREFCGYGTSVIGCDAEAGCERPLLPAETPDGRAGMRLMLFAFSTDALQSALSGRVGQCLMTCPTTAVFDGLRKEEQPGHETWQDFAAGKLAMGNRVRYFGDGYQKSKLLNQRRYWRIPVMDGEFIVEDTAGVVRGVAGGNFLILARDQPTGLAAAGAAVDAMSPLPVVILPFPGGVVRSGSKVGSRYSKLVASTADAWCPTLRGRVDSRLSDKTHCVYEIVIDGIDFESVAAAMKVGIEAACTKPIERISAGNYGGNLGKHHFHLHQLFP